MIIIEMHLLQYAPSRSFKKSLRLQTNVVGVRWIVRLREEHDCRLCICGETTDVHLWWRTDDRRRIRQLAFFSFAISVSISPCMSGSCDFFQSLSHFLSLNRHSPPWVMVCFRSVSLSLIALLKQRTHGAMSRLVARSRQDN